MVGKRNETWLRNFVVTVVFFFEGQFTLTGLVGSRHEYIPHQPGGGEEVPEGDFLTAG